MSVKASKITSVSYVGNIGTTPARVNRVTGALYINTEVFNKLPVEHQTFVLLHEEGHVVLNSTDEYAVDSYAFDKYVQLGYSLKQAVMALTSVLNNNVESHRLRADYQLQRAKQFDFERNKNNKTYQKNYDTYNPKNYKNMSDFNSELVDFKSKAERKEKRAVKQDYRKEKKTVKIETKRGAIEQKRLLAMQGKTKGGAFTQGIGAGIQRAENLGVVAASIASGTKIGEVQPIGQLDVQNENQLIRTLPSNATPPVVEQLSKSNGNSMMQNTLESGGDAVNNIATRDKNINVAKSETINNPTLPDNGSGEPIETKKKKTIIIVGIVIAVLVVAFFLIKKMKK
jgi:hypothetical protein